MDFALKVVLSFLVGGAYVSGVIWLSEHLGSRVGGAVAGLPSTILVGLAFIDITEGTAATRSAVKIVPLIFTAALVYGLVFLIAARKFKGPRRSIKASLAATIAWLAVVLPLKFVFENAAFLTICLVAALGLLAFRYFFRNFSTTLPKKIPLPRHIYDLRFIIGGTIIAAAVVAARVAGPVWGGVVASLPALLGTVFYFLNKSQGDKFLEGFIRRLPLSYISSFTFLVIIYQLLPHLSDPLSFLLAMAGALTYTLLLILYKRTAEQV
ncbi:MAG: hypothetical protein AAB541_01135 [Patescibacteria group bacterium]